MYKNFCGKVHKEIPRGTVLTILIPGESLTDQLDKFTDAEVFYGEIRIDDGRTIRADQRKKAWAILGDISNYNGDDKDTNHGHLKNEYTTKTGEELFSLRDCSVTTARHYISFLLDFCMEWGIALSAPLNDRTDDISAAIYSSLMHKRCIVCGQPGELHHVDRVGMGRNRREIVHIGMSVMCLCRLHHDESHQIGQSEFDEKWKVYGIKADEAVCKTYRLKSG